MKDRAFESRAARRDQIVDDLGIDWPQSVPSANEIGWIVRRSKKEPLRLLVARRLLDEGITLLQDYSCKQNPTPLEHAQLIAVKDGFVETGLMVNETEGLLKTSRTGYGDSLARARVSYLNDPSGKNWLESLNLTKTFEYDTVSGLTPLKQELRSELVGFRAGIDRYKALYDAAASYGAWTDGVMVLPNGFISRPRPL